MLKKLFKRIFHRHQWDTYLITTGIDYQQCTVCGSKRTITTNGNVLFWG